MTVSLLVVDNMHRNTHCTSTTASAASTATTASTSAGGSAAAVLGAGALCAAAGTLSMGLGSAGKLDGDLAVEDGLAVELSDGTLSLGWGREGDEGVSNGTRGTGVGGDGCGLAV